MHGYQWPFSTLLNESQNAGPNLCFSTPLGISRRGERKKKTDTGFKHPNQTSYDLSVSFALLKSIQRNISLGETVFVSMCQQGQTCLTVDRVHEHLFQRDTSNEFQIVEGFWSMEQYVMSSPRRIDKQKCTRACARAHTQTNTHTRCEIPQDTHKSISALSRSMIPSVLETFHSCSWREKEKSSHNNTLQRGKPWKNKEERSERKRQRQHLFDQEIHTWSCLVACLLSMYDAWGPIPSPIKTLRWFMNSNCNTEGQEKRGSKVPSHPWLHRKFKPGLSYLRQSQKAELHSCADWRKGRPQKNSRVSFIWPLNTSSGGGGGSGGAGLTQLWKAQLGKE